MVNFPISIIVPVFNAKPYLISILDSVLNQSYKNFELIFVNDGSVDDSLELLLEIQKKDSRIKVYSQENKGVTAARKLGWEKSTGSYITFLDADDFFLENSLEVLIFHAKNGDYDIVNAAFTSVPGGRVWRNKHIGEFSKRDYLKSLIFGETYGVLYASIYKKELFKESTFSFDESIKIGEDVLMNIEICERVSKIKNIDKLVYNYTDDNKNSAMKVIIRHPDYYQKYNSVKNNLIKKIDKVLYEEIKEEMESQDNDVIIKAFFSPFIKFNFETYESLKKIRKKTKNNLFSLALTNTYITMILKNYFNILFLSKNFILRKKYSKKNMIS